MAKKTKNRNYVDKDQFHLLFNNYNNNPNDETFAALHPLLNTLIEMLVWKILGRANDNKNNDRGDIEAIKQNCYLRVFKIIENKNYNKKYCAFGFIYRCMLNEICFRKQEMAKNIKKHLLLTEMENESENENGPRDTLDRITELSYTVDIGREEAWIHDLLTFAKTYNKGKSRGEELLFGQKLIELFQTKNWREKLVFFKEAQSKHDCNATLPSSVLAHTFAANNKRQVRKFMVGGRIFYQKFVKWKKDNLNPTPSH